MRGHDQDKLVKSDPNDTPQGGFLIGDPGQQPDSEPAAIYRLEKLCHAATRVALVGVVVLGALGLGEALPQTAEARTSPAAAVVKLYNRSSAIARNEPAPLSPADELSAEQETVDGRLDQYNAEFSTSVELGSGVKANVYRSGYDSGQISTDPRLLM